VDSEGKTVVSGQWSVEEKEKTVSMELLSDGEFNKIQALCRETGRMLNALSSSIKNKKASSKTKCN
jgi:hypothetical protein